MNATTRISTWGNSLAVRIPSHLARQGHFVDGGSVELTVVDGALVISPVDTLPSFNITELVAAITDENRHVEVSSGHAQGNEFV